MELLKMFDWQDGSRRLIPGGLNGKDYKEATGS
jgi:hypothetical protein